MNTSKRYTREEREHAVRLVFDQQGQHTSQWAAILSISGKLGCTTETLRRWVRQSEREQGKRSGVPSADRDRLKELERENRELKRANTHWAQVRYCAMQPLFSPRRSSTADRSNGVLHRRLSGEIRGRADLPATADCPVHLLRTQSTGTKPG